MILEGIKKKKHKNPVNFGSVMLITCVYSVRDSKSGKGCFNSDTRHTPVPDGSVGA